MFAKFNILNKYTLAAATICAVTAIHSAAFAEDDNTQTVSPKKCNGTFSDLHPRADVTITICTESNGKKWIYSANIPVQNDRFAKDAAIQVIVDQNGTHAWLERKGLKGFPAHTEANDQYDREKLLNELHALKLFVSADGLHLRAPAKPSTPSDGLPAFDVMPTWTKNIVTLLLAATTTVRTPYEIKNVTMAHPITFDVMNRVMAYKYPGWKTLPTYKVGASPELWKPSLPPSDVMFALKKETVPAIPSPAQAAPLLMTYAR